MREDMTDDEHVSYMLDGGDRGLIESFIKTEDSIGFGGGIVLHRELPAYKYLSRPGGPKALPVGRRSEFYAQRFALDTGASGVAVWFWTGEDPVRPRRRANRTLCGWVPLAREAELAAWLEELNRTIQANLDRVGAPTTEAELEVAMKAHTQGNIALLRGLGLTVPDADNMDELVTRLEEAGRDGPIDARGKASGRGTPENR